MFTIHLPQNVHRTYLRVYAQFFFTIINSLTGKCSALLRTRESQPDNNINKLFIVVIGSTCW
jgi:hypothetical protein